MESYGTLIAGVVFLIPIATGVVGIIGLMRNLHNDKAEIRRTHESIGEERGILNSHINNMISVQTEIREDLREMRRGYEAMDDRIDEVFKVATHADKNATLANTRIDNLQGGNR